MVDEGLFDVGVQQKLFFEFMFIGLGVVVVDQVFTFDGDPFMGLGVDETPVEWLGVVFLVFVFYVLDVGDDTV